jgi:hypothetical protein
VHRSTFYGWYQRYLDRGFEGLHDKKPAPRGRWNAIPERVQKEVLDLALERTDLSPRELACRYTDAKRYFVSESSVYRISVERACTQALLPGASRPPIGYADSRGASGSRYPRGLPDRRNA